MVRKIIGRVESPIHDSSHPGYTIVVYTSSSIRLVSRFDHDDDDDDINNEC